MDEKMIRAPEGMRDALFDECAARREREAELYELFNEEGFREVATPVFERYELLTRTGSPLSEEMMVKVIGGDGRICVLRPDNTAPIARLAATRLKNVPAPLKLWYAQPVFRAHEDGIREIRQAGIEIIGGKTNNHTIISLASKAAERYFGQMPQIEINHVRILPKLLRHLGIQGKQKERALSLIERKNFAELGDEFPHTGELLKLVRISGGTEALEEAAGMFGQLLDEHLSKLRGLMDKLGDRQVTVDFALTPSLQYYNGIFFRGYVEGAAGAVLTGGRYDKLMGLLGRDALAVGFAINME